MNHYLPGQGIRGSLISTVNGVLTDPSNLTATMSLPDGSVTSATPVQDSQGMWHADWTIPYTCPKGIGFYAFRSTGATPAQNASKQERFFVDALGNVAP